MAFMNSNAPSNPYLAVSLWDQAEHEEVLEFVAKSSPDSKVAKWLSQEVPKGVIPLHQPDHLFATVILLCNEVSQLRDRVSELEAAQSDKGSSLK